MDFSHIASSLSASPLTAIPVLFLAGVFTSLTPCIYPMIPITAAIVGGQTAGGARGLADSPPRRPMRAVVLTLTYVVGLALVYSALGLFAGLSGTIFGTVSSNPWLYFGMANMLVLAALAMLDVVPVRMPGVLVRRAASAGTGGRLSGAFAMGAMSGLVAAPCSAPVMAAVLTWVTRTRSAALGFAYLFSFSLGMCALLVAVGVSSGTLAHLPRAGVWMLRVKKLFAFVMLAMAEYYLIKMGEVWI